MGGRRIDEWVAGAGWVEEGLGGYWAGRWSGRCRPIVLDLPHSYHTGTLINKLRNLYDAANRMWGTNGTRTGSTDSLSDHLALERAKIGVPF